MKTFQQPLTAQEENEYLNMLNSEEREVAQEARRILIERNLRLVAHVAKKYAQTGEDMEDLISIGTIGLIKAITTFRPEKGNRLGTYAAKCIDNELLMMFRARKKSTREISLYEPIGRDKEGNEINLLDICVQEQVDIVENMDQMDKINKLKLVMEKVLDDREKEIIQLRFGLGREKEMTQREIGKMQGISRSYVSRIEKRALTKMLREFIKNKTKNSSY